MAKKIKIIFLLLHFLFVFTLIPSIVISATLNWDPSSEPEVTGYNIYYRTEAPSFPFNGTALPEGDSPIYVEGATSTSLDITIPDDGNVYFFTATAVASTGLESDFSEIIASNWIPDLLSPADNNAVNTNVIFDWGQPPTENSYVFDLYYGTDPNFNLSASVGTFTPPRIDRSSANIFALSGLIILLLILVIKSFGRTARVWRPVRVAACIGILVLQASCGGSSSTSTPVGSSPDSGTTDPTTPAMTNVVYNLSETEYQVAELEPGTQYYWKVVATDNWGNRFESFAQTFTTSAN